MRKALFLVISIGIFVALANSPVLAGAEEIIYGQMVYVTASEDGYTAAYMEIAENYEIPSEVEIIFIDGSKKQIPIEKSILDGGIQYVLYSTTVEASKANPVAVTATVEVGSDAFLSLDYARGDQEYFDALTFYEIYLYLQEIAKDEMYFDLLRKYIVYRSPKDNFWDP